MASFGPDSAATRVAPAPPAQPDPLAGLRTWAAEAPTVFWLAAIVMLSAAARFALALASAAPWIIPDELIYSELAKSFAATGHFAVRDMPFSVWSFGPLYPMLIAPVYRIVDSVPAAYIVVKAINSLSMSAAAVPAYFIARRLVSRRAALIAAALTILVPSAVYTTKLMTESVSYPIFLVTVLAMIRALERPSTKKQVLLLALMTVAVLSRAQMIVLFPALLTALLVVAMLDERRLGAAIRRSFREFRLTWIVSLAGLALPLAAAMSVRSTRDTLLGQKEGIVHGISVLAIPQWFVYHLAEIDLYAGVIPFAAFVLLLARVVSRQETAREIRVFVATSAALFFWLLLQTAFYMSSRQPPRVFDRYVFYVVPLMLIALMTWIRIGLPRRHGVAVAVAAAAWLLPAVLPFKSLLNGAEWGASSSAAGLVFWYVIRRLAELGGVGFIFLPILLLVTGRLALLVLRSTRATSAALVRLTVIYLAVMGMIVQIANNNVAARAADYGLGSASPSWIDAAVGPDAHVPVIWSGTARRTVYGWYTVWENEFFNRSVGRVYYLREPMRYTLPQTRARFDDGLLVAAGGRTIHTQYVLADVTVPLVGKVIARDTDSGMVLYRVGGSVRAQR